jgi:hypothetical protein
MFSLLLSASLVVVPTPTPRPVPPCQAAHRLFCGPIRLVPRDPQERTAFVDNAIATLIDGVVTATNTRGNPSLEANPVMRPFVRGGLPGLLLGWTGMEVGQRTIARRFHLDDTRIESMTLSEHLSGIASWLSPRTYGWVPNEWQMYHQPAVEAAWIRWDANAGRY